MPYTALSLTVTPNPSLQPAPLGAERCRQGDRDVTLGDADGVIAVESPWGIEPVLPRLCPKCAQLGLIGDHPGVLVTTMTA